MGLIRIVSRNSGDDMGINMDKTWDEEKGCFVHHPKPLPLPNPNPSNFKIVKTYKTPNLEGNKYTAIKVIYPDCTNYEGEKVMVWRAIDLAYWIDHNKLDPHFSKQVPSCIARFCPDSFGWLLAIDLVDTLEKGFRLVRK